MNNQFLVYLFCDVVRDRLVDERNDQILKVIQDYNQHKTENQ